MFRVAVVLLCAATAVYGAAEVDSNSGIYNGVQTSYGVPQQQSVVRTGYESHQYQNPGYGVDPAAYEDEAGLLPGPISALLGYKFTAVGFVVKAIGWLILHSWAIILGAAATFAFCKVTHVCDLSYHKFAADHINESFRSLMTPERIARASKIFNDAMHKYSGAKN